MPSSVAETPIRTSPLPNCYICGAEGQPLYSGLQDRIFGAPGKWNMKQCPNPACGLAWLDPMPIEEDIWKLYERYYTHGDQFKEQFVKAPSRLINLSILKRLYLYLKRGFYASIFNYRDGVNKIQQLGGFSLYLHPSLARTLARRIRYVKYAPGGRLLDVGCGDSTYLDRMRYLGWEVEGVEVDPQAVEQGRKIGLPINLGPLDDQEYDDNTFDVIAMSHVLEHVHDPRALLEECWRILKPGGTLFAFVPNGESLGHRLFKDSWRGLEPPRHLFLFTLPALGKAVAKIGPDIHLRTSGTTARGIYHKSVFIASSHPRIKHTLPRLSAFRGAIFSLCELIGILTGKPWGEEIILQGTKA